MEGGRERDVTCSGCKRLTREGDQNGVGMNEHGEEGGGGRPTSSRERRSEQRPRADSIMARARAETQLR